MVQTIFKLNQNAILAVIIPDGKIFDIVLNNKQ